MEAGTGIIQTVAGTGKRGTSPDGIPATQASLNVVAGIAFGSGTLYILDRSFDQSTASVRAVYPPVPPSLPQPPKILEVTDAINFGNAFSPGGLISIMGNYLGPASPASGQIGADGRFTKSLAGDQVTVQGIPAPLLYVSAGQINAVIPYAAALGKAQVGVSTAWGVDTLSDNPSGGSTLPITLTPTSLSFFPNLVFNPDGSLNSKTNPAPKGATLMMYGTGIGVTTPVSSDGAIVSGPVLPQPVNKFSATVQGSSQLNADLLYLGPLPGFVAGAAQANIRMPDGADPGTSNLIISPVPPSGGSVSQTVFLLADPPVITGITPPSPVPQTIGYGIQLTLTGKNFKQITQVNYYFNGAPLTADTDQYINCSSPSSCSISLNRTGGKAGDYAVELVNAVN